MNLLFDDNAFEELKYWVERDRKKAAKILNIIEDVNKTPFSGLSKPEPLKYALQGCWSRRIDQEHRLVYQISGNVIRILSCRYHY